MTNSNSQIDTMPGATSGTTMRAMARHQVAPDMRAEFVELARHRLHQQLAVAQAGRQIVHDIGEHDDPEGAVERRRDQRDQEAEAEHDAGHRHRHHRQQRNALSRPAAGCGGLIDRYLVAIQQGGAAAAIFVNKLDLLQDPTEFRTSTRTASSESL